MSIILNEVEWVEELLKDPSLEDNAVETLTRVARYYFSKGFSKKEVRTKTELFLLQCNPLASIPLWTNTMDHIIKNAAKRAPLEITGIPITESEIDKINAIKSKRERRLAFTLLCLSKYWDLLNQTDSHWVNSQMKDIMKMANISTSFKNQCLLYKSLKDSGLIELSKKIDNTNVRVLFSNAGDEKIVSVITDFRNLGYQFQRLTGESFYQCENCGLIFKTKKNTKRGRPPKYCPDCAREIYIKQTIDSVMSKRLGKVALA